MTTTKSNKVVEDIQQTEGAEKCETCEKRTYADGSNEGDVSFKTPGHISPEASASIVSAHEYEHVRNAMQEDKKHANINMNKPIAIIFFII